MSGYDKFLGEVIGSLELSSSPVCNQSCLDSKMKVSKGRNKGDRVNSTLMARVKLALAKGSRSTDMEVRACSSYLAVCSDGQVVFELYATS